ncbi:hypothetical protein D3C86_536040 [compost metagenome]
MLAVHAFLGRDELQPHLGIGLAADLGHHVVDAPADHVLDRPGLALADADDAIARLERAVDRHRTAGDDLTDHHHVVLALQLRADAFQRQRHGLVEVLGGARGEVIGVRIDRAGVGIEEELEHVLALQLVDRLFQRRVALVQRLADLRRLLAGQLQAQPVVFDRLAPEVVKLGIAGRPRHVLAVVLELFVAAEIELLLELLARKADAFAHALLVHRKHLEGRLQLTTADGRGDVGLERGEAGDVGLGEELLAAVQCFQIALEHVLGRGRVERARPVGVTAVRQQSVNQLGGGHLVGRRRRGQRRRIGIGGQCQRRGERQGHQECGGFEFHQLAHGTLPRGRLRADQTTRQCRKLPGLSSTPAQRGFPA